VAREMGGLPTTGGKGQVHLVAHMEKKYIGLKLDEMEKG